MVKELITDIDLDNIANEFKRIRNEVVLYQQVRDELVKVVQLNQEWSADHLAYLVFDQCKVSEEFMQYYAIQQQMHIKDSVIVPTLAPTPIRKRRPPNKRDLE